LTALTSKALLIEHFEEAIRIGSKEILNVNEDKVKIKIVMDYSLFHENIDSRKRDNLDTKDEKNDENKIDVKNLQLLFHEPNRVVKLQSDLFPLCFGYLVFPKTVLNPNYMMQDQVVNSICTSILKSLEKRIPQISEYADNDDLKRLIVTMVKETDESKALNIRYVPPDRIQHFMVPSTKYYPYGESIFDSCQFTAKVLIALETALAIQRLSRSTEKRKIGIEIGLPRDARKMVEKLKEEFRKRKISLDSFGTIDTIPSLISTFEDVYIPQKDGKAFVDIGTFAEGNVDIRGKVDELKFLRDSVIASLGVPASFLNLEENLSNKCLDLFTKIPLLNGKTITLKDLIVEYEETGELKDKYTYSYDKKTGKIVPGEISWAGITRKNAKVIQVTLDNGKSEIVTPDHKFMLRNGEYVEAQFLESGDSLMPLYTKLTCGKTTTKHIPYKMVYHPGIEKWELVHRVVAKHEGMVTDGSRLNVHHKNFNPLNNSPLNLEGLTHYDHVKTHIEHKHFITTGRGNVKQENYVEGTCIICGKTFIKHISSNQITCLKKECMRERSRLDGLKNGRKTSKQIFFQCPFCGQLFSRAPYYIKSIKSPYMTCGMTECYKKSFRMYNNTPERKELAEAAGRKGGNKSKFKLVAYNKEHGAPMKGRTKETDPEIFERRLNTLRANLNHKVLMVEFLNYTIDTGDITVNKYHNFAVESGIIISNSALGEENILFARTIVAHQKYLTKNVNGLIKKIFDIINPEMALTLFDHVLIALPPPKSLQFERESKYIGDLATLVEALERLGIPKEWAISKYLTNIDWGELKNFEINDIIDKKLGTAKKEDEGMGGGMGGMGPTF
jgi:hypothetical protein